MIFNHVSHEINMKLKCRNFQTHEVGILYLNIFFCQRNLTFVISHFIIFVWKKNLHCLIIKKAELGSHDPV